LNEQEIDVDELPATAFDSPQEKERVTKLFEEYNDPSVEEPAESQDNSAEPSAVPPPISAPSQDSAAGSNQTAAQATKPEQPAQEEQSQEPAEQHEPPPEMTPALDAAFGQIARERIARAPLRYYVWVPLKRMRTLWFGSHSEYYPFTGELFPLDDLDHSTHQHVWLPLFELLVWIYTLLGLAGAWRLWRSTESASRRWLLLAGLMIFLRLAFFSSKENPEPRYTVEVFPFLAILGGIALARIIRYRSRDQVVDPPLT